MLRLRTRLKRIDSSYEKEVLALVNSGFIGKEPEILLPQSLAQELKLSEVSRPKTTTRTLATGVPATLQVHERAVKVKVVTEDRESNEVTVNVLVAPRATIPLLNDKLISKLQIVILDAGEGLWCFKDELGRKVRKTE